MILYHDKYKIIETCQHNEQLEQLSTDFLTLIVSVCSKASFIMTIRGTKSEWFFKYDTQI